MSPLNPTVPWGIRLIDTDGRPSRVSRIQFKLRQEGGVANKRPVEFPPLGTNKLPCTYVAAEIVVSVNGVWTPYFRVTLSVPIKMVNRGDRAIFDTDSVIVPHV